MMNIKAIGERISSLRKEQGLTGEKFAELLGVSPQAVSKWETGKNLPETILLPSISRVLEVSIDSILIPPQILPNVNIKILSDFVLMDEKGGPPSIANTNNTYYLTFGHTPNHHPPYVDGHSEIRMATSVDGKMWGKPKTIYSKKEYKICNPCIHALADGSLLVTYYLYKDEPAYKKPMLEKILSPFIYEEPCPDGRNTISYLVGQYTIISHDGGETFSSPNLMESNCAFFGKIVQLPDGTILAPLCRYGNDPAKDGVAVIYASKNGGYDWGPYSYVCGPINNCSPEEPGLFITWCKRIYCFIRTSTYMYYCISKDYGQTWSEPLNSWITGNVPFDALQLPSGHVLLHYGRRDDVPFSIRAVLLDYRKNDLNDISPESEMIIRGGSMGGIAYNWAVQLPDNEILVAYNYINDDVNGGQEHIAGTILKIEYL